MKKLLLIVTLLFCLSFVIFALSANYNNGNGTIISNVLVNSINWEIRTHKQVIEIGNLADPENLLVYDDILSMNIIKELSIGTKIQILQIARAAFNGKYHVWLNILVDKKSGWILFGSFSYDFAQFSDPYFNNRWEILRTIQTSRIWTIRKMVYQHVAVWVVLNIRDKPGMSDTQVISKIERPVDGNPQVNLLVQAATEETETINGIEDRWLEVEYNGVKGWIFGGYTTVERGGAKYITPDSILDSGLGYY